MTSVVRSFAWVFPAVLWIVFPAPMLVGNPDPPVTPTVFDEPALVQGYQHRITAKDLSELVHHLASDDFAGRETSTKGQRAAARYLAEYYFDLGLKPGRADSGLGPDAYRQEFDLYGPELSRASLRFSSSRTGEVGFVYDPLHPDTTMYLAAGTLKHVAGPVQFRSLSDALAGVDYEDYSVLQPGTDETGASWVLSFAPDSLLQPSGATGPYSSNTTWPRLHLHVPYDGGPLPLGLILVADQERVARESRLLADVALSVGRLAIEPGNAPYDMPPVYVVNPDVAAILLEGSGLTIEYLRRLVEQDGAEAIVDLPGVKITSEVDFPVRPFRTENVVACVEGIDPDLKDEYVIVSAHFDHVGVNPLLSSDTIFNGADDNASGTAAMMEMAEAFQEARSAGFGPRRSIVFAHFTAEEKGLLGSRYYTDIDPIFPLDKTVANINIDMIGRADPQRSGDDEPYVYVIGSRLISDELHEIASQVNSLTGTDLILDERYNTMNDPNQFYKRSDQWNFGRRGIPIIFFFTGTHEDYHRPSDEAHMLDYERLAEISRLIFGTTWQLASQEHGLKIDAAVD